MTRHEPPDRMPPLPLDWHVVQRPRRDFGPPRLDALGRAALFVFAALACTYLVAWLAS